MLKNEGVKGSYLEYKGRPLVRQNNEIWYGDLSEEYHTYMMIMGEKTVDGEKVPDKIMIQLMKKGEKAPEKQSIGNGLADALDTANAWLERKNK